MKGSEFIKLVHEAEQAISEMAVTDDVLMADIEKLHKASVDNVISPNEEEFLRNSLAVDKTVKSVGNKAAYRAFVARNSNPGIYMFLDANDFGHLGEELGMDEQNRAVVRYGDSIRHAVDTVAGKKGRVFRLGGDRFVAHVPSMDHAAEAARTLRDRLESLPPAGGVHGHSMSIGFGRSPNEAERALIQAKSKKDSDRLANKHRPGESTQYHHSFVSGHPDVPG